MFFFIIIEYDNPISRGGFMLVRLYVSDFHLNNNCNNCLNASDRSPFYT
jgi:hypothetical protein